jgi:hypothetical protein
MAEPSHPQWTATFLSHHDVVGSGVRGRGMLKTAMQLAQRSCYLAQKQISADISREIANIFQKDEETYQV